MSPASGLSRPASSLRVVVLPQPEGPSREKNSPRAIAKETSCTAGAEPKDLLTPRNSAIGDSARLMVENTPDWTPPGVAPTFGNNPPGPRHAATRSTHAHRRDCALTAALTTLGGGALARGRRPS